MRARRPPKRHHSALRRSTRQRGSNSPDTTKPRPADRRSTEKILRVRPSAIPDSLLSTLASAIPPEQRPDEPLLASAPYLVEFDESESFDLDVSAEPPADETLPVVDPAYAAEIPSNEKSPEIDPARATKLPEDEFVPE